MTVVKGEDFRTFMLYVDGWRCEGSAIAADLYHWTSTDRSPGKKSKYEQSTHDEDFDSAHRLIITMNSTTSRSAITK